MNAKLYLDAEIYPPFEGFPEQGIKFLKQLKKNNNREWFNKHKSDYEDYVKLPMRLFRECVEEKPRGDSSIVASSNDDDF